MGRQDENPIMVSSSIVLLQERFKELEKVREKRQEKELLKLFSEPSERATSTMHPHQQPTTLTSQPEMMFPNRTSPPFQDSLLSLGLNSPSRHPEFRATKSPPPSSSSSSSIWPTRTNGSSSRGFENSDVDTSLHL